MPSESPIHDDEIDLFELFRGIVRYWKSIVVMMGLCAVLTTSYGLYVVKPVYKSTAVFAFKSSSGGSGSLGGLAALAGLNVSLPTQDTNTSIPDLIDGRIFIEEVIEKEHLFGDPYFNTSLRGPRRLHRIAAVFGVQMKVAPPTISEINDVIINRYLASVTFSDTTSGSSQLTVKHEDAKRAAQITNAIVDLIQEHMTRIEKEKKSVTYSFLKQELVKAQEALDIAQNAVTGFVLTHNIQSKQDLVQASVQLENLRQRQSLARRALQEYDLLIAAPSSQRTDMLQTLTALRDPLLQTLGVQLISQNTLSRNLARRVQADRSALISYLDTTRGPLERLAQGAENAAQDAKDLQKLEGALAVEEAAYKAIIAQYKEHSVSSGFEDSLGTVYQYGTPSTRSSNSSLTLFLALGLVLGGFIGAILSIIRNMRAGWIYGRKTLQSLTGTAPFIKLPKPITKICQRPWQKQVLKQITAKHALDMMGLLSQLSALDRKYIYFSTAHSGYNLAQGVSALLAQQWAKVGLRTVIVTFSTRVSDVQEPEPLSENLDQLIMSDALTKMSKNELVQSLKQHTLNYERVVIMPTTEFPDELVLSALGTLPIVHGLAARLGLTQRHKVEEVTEVSMPDMVVLL